jgi:hypothetical protein
MTISKNRLIVSLIVVRRMCCKKEIKSPEN